MDLKPRETTSLRGFFVSKARRILGRSEFTFVVIRGTLYARNVGRLLPLFLPASFFESFYLLSVPSFDVFDFFVSHLRLFWFHVERFLSHPMLLSDLVHR